MKLIFTVSAMHGGGAERVVATLANLFAAGGDEVTILMTAGSESVYPLDPAIKLLSIGDTSKGNPFLQVRRLHRMRAYFKARRESVVVSFSTTINLFTILATLGLPNPVVVSERNDPNRCGYAWLRNLIYFFGKKFVFQTEEAKACFSERIQKRSAVIPNPIRKDLPPPPFRDGMWESATREKKIAAVGRLEPQKNHMLLLEAFAGFHKHFPSYTLHIFGKGSLEGDLRERARTLNIDTSVIFEGFSRDVLEQIKTYDMYVLSSDYEGIPNSLLEAMAVGLPCIATDCPIGGPAMCMEDGVNGLLVPVGDAAALQGAMERVAASGEAQEDGLAAALGAAAVRVRERFAEKKIADMWRTFMEEAL